MSSDSYLTTAVPTKRQLEFQDWEFGIFLHFGIRTFYEGRKDWDGKPMEAVAFNPTDLDCDRWARKAVDAGAKYMVLTAKHHDGFALWPSKCTDFSVGHAAWKNGGGDVVREYTDACRRHGLKVGLYYSPADASATKYENPKAYDDYFIGQVSEILTGYGDVDILWFDGCGSEGHEYDWVRIMAEIRRMQPQILIFNMGDPDFRWIGNESGVASVPTWNTVDSVDFSVNTTEKQQLDGQSVWLPAECDCRTRDENWFFSSNDENTVKPVEELLSLWYMSVGRGCNVLINVPPDRSGQLPELDTTRLIEMQAELTRRFAEPVASLGNALQESDSVTWTFPKTARVDHVVIQENLTAGEHIRKFRIEAEVFPYSGPIVLWEGQNIGHKAICHFPLVRVKSLTLKIAESTGDWSLRSTDLFNSSR